MSRYYNLSEEIFEIAQALNTTANALMCRARMNVIDLDSDYDVNRGTTNLGKVAKEIERLYGGLRGKLEAASCCLARDSDYGFDSLDGNMKCEVSQRLVHITLPGMLPLKTDYYAIYLPQKLHTLLEHVSREARANGERLPFFTKAAVIFLHQIEEEKAANGKLRDYDNLERKSILDILRTYFFYSDNMAGLISMDSSFTGAESSTEIFICDMAGLPELISVLQRDYGICKPPQKPDLMR